MARVLVNNKAAYHDYSIDDKTEAGIVLAGWEVKSIKAGRVNIRGSYIYADPNQDLWLRGMHVSEWIGGEKHAEAVKTRDRKLLLHKSQAIKYANYGRRPGYALIPLELIEGERGLIKVLVALVKGRKQYEKKRAIKEKELKRELRML